MKYWELIKYFFSRHPDLLQSFKELLGLHNNKEPVIKFRSINEKGKLKCCFKNCQFIFN